jgi:ribosomal protein S24E
MAITIQTKEPQELLGRVRVTAHLSFDKATPNKMEVRKQLSKELKEKEEQIIVKHIYTSFGQQSATVEAMVYDDPSKALEHKKLLEKHQPKQTEEAKS